VTDDGVVDALPLSYRDFIGTTPKLLQDFFVSYLKDFFSAGLVEIRTLVPYV